jgi:hypothetical protein
MAQVVALILDQENSVKDNYILDDPSEWGFVNDKDKKVSPPKKGSVPLKEKARGNNVFVSLNEEDFFQLSSDGVWTELDGWHDFELRGYITASREEILSLVG